MYIERDGVKIELTQEELNRAYEEVHKGHVKDDIMCSFVNGYLGGSESYEFDDFIDEMSSNKGFPSAEYREAYEELCDGFGQSVIDGLIENPEGFLDAVYEVFNNDLDSNEDYNSQIAWAVKSVLCDKAHETKELYAQAWNDLLSLRKLVQNYEGTFDELCEQLNGFNKEDGSFFDVNYGALTITIDCTANGYALDERSIDIWNDAATELIHECLNFDKLKELCVRSGVDVEKVYSGLEINDLNKTLIEDGNKYVLNNVELPCNDKTDYEKLDSFCGDMVCRIYLKEAPNSEFESIAREKDEEYYSPDCFFIEATMGRDSIEDSFATSNWFLFYVTNEGDRMFLDDSAELLDAWEYFHEHILENEVSLDNKLADAKDRSEMSDKSAGVEPEQVLD